MAATRARVRPRHNAGMRIVLPCVLLGGCVAYKPGSFTHAEGPFAGQRATVGCVELGIQRRADMEQKAVLGYSFGNRCDRPAVVDLAYARVRGRTMDGEEVTLRPYDPEAELQPLRLDGRTAGHEALAYEASGALAQICVDVASIARQPGEQWMCFADGERDPIFESDPPRVEPLAATADVPPSDPPQPREVQP